MKGSTLATGLRVASLLVVIGGCQAILDLPAKVTAYRWCLDAEPAQGLRADNDDVMPIFHAESKTWMRGCKCYCPCARKALA